jgi:hypothetical protein
MQGHATYLPGKYVIFERCISWVVASLCADDDAITSHLFSMDVQQNQIHALLTIFIAT